MLKNPLIASSQQSLSEGKGRILMLNADDEKLYKLLICLQIGDITFCKYFCLLVTVVVLWLFLLYMGTNGDERMEMISESNDKTQRRSKQ